MDLYLDEQTSGQTEKYLQDYENVVFGGADNVLSVTKCFICARH